MMNETKTDTTIQDLAKRYYDMLTVKTRDNGESLISSKDDLSETDHDELQSLCFAAHSDGDFFPDDYRYDWLHTFLDDLSNGTDPDDINIEADIYTHDLTTWLNSNTRRVEYLNEAIREFGNDVAEPLSAGQYLEKQETWYAVQHWLEAKLEEIN